MNPSTTRAIAYKEWLKIRWVYAGLALLFLLLLAKIALDISYIGRFQRPVSVWYNIVFRGWLFYDLLRYIPLIAGIALAVAQFFPEALQARLKLTLHLPVRENSALLQMLVYGLGMLGLLLLAVMMVLGIITRISFPSEVLTSVLLTTAPWFAAGLVAFCAAACIIIDHRWPRRVVLLLLAAGLLQGYFESGSYNLYAPSIGYFLLLGIPFAAGFLLSGYRFRRGVR